MNKFILYFIRFTLTLHPKTINVLMMRKLYICGLIALMSVFTLGASAQRDGFYRMKNVATNHVANISGHTHFAPNVTMEEAYTLPGTVAEVAFEDVTLSKLVVQNVDAINMVIPVMKEMVLETIDEERFVAMKDTMILYVASYMAADMADLVIPLIQNFTYENFQDYVANADANIYYEDAGDGRYYLYVNTPKFPLNAGILTGYLTGIANGYLDRLRYRIESLMDMYLIGRQYLKPVAYSLANNIYFDDKLYLTEQNDNTYGAQFGFASSKNISQMGEAALWNLMPVNEEDYLAVEGQVLDNDGNWYTSIALGFQVKLSEGMKAFYLTDAVDANKSEVVMKEIEGDVIPPMTPVILKLNGPSAADNKLTPVRIDTELVDPVYYADNALSCATDSLGLLFGFSLDAPDKRYYVLGNVDGNACMVETTQTYFEANTPYYFLTDDKKAKEKNGYLKFVNEIDGITTVTAHDMNSNTIYDLQGRRVVNPTRGLYIVNGRKVVRP